MSDTVQQIKERLNIQDIIGPYVRLTKAGKSLRGLCPFHKEKTPSFHVSPERGTWHCFGCGIGGDVFSFIEKAEGVDFKGSLKILAEKAGVEITSIYGVGRKEDTSKKDRLREVIRRACEWYASKFKGSPAEAYTKQRGFSDDTNTAWRLGYAPDSWRSLLEILTSEGFSIQELISAGLIKEADGKPGTYYDRFRNRLMFPIQDIAGRVIAFTGRTLDADTPDTGLQNAKYLNSPETDLYHKSEILFGMDRAKDAIRTRGFTMLVEGQVDVILAHQAGFSNAIALSGTALSEQHLKLMRRYSENLMLVLDSDPAGFRATARSAELALKYELRVKAVQLPIGEDPADLISKDSNEFKQCIASAKPIVEFLIAELANRNYAQHQLIRASKEIILPLINAMSSPMEREHFIQHTARALDLSSESIRAELKRLPANQSEHSYNIDTVKMPPESTQRSVSDIRKEQLLAIVQTYPKTPLVQRVISEYCRITEAQKLPSVVLPESVLFQIEQTFGEKPGEKDGDELLRAFEEAVIREAYQEAVTSLRRAEASKDVSSINVAQSRCAKLSARLSMFGG